MTTVGEAVAALGIVQDGGEIVIVKLKEGTARNYLLSEVADRMIDEDLYMKTGTFATGSVSRYSGASRENLVRINELPFDFDASDYFEIPKAELWSYPDSALWPLIEHLQREVETTFAAIGLELHRIDYTGYGLAGYLRLPLHKPEAIPALLDLHARIVERVNKIARARMCDPQVKDAGTRFMRVPGCLNTKGPIHRLTRTLVQREGMVNEAQLTAAAGAVSRMQARIVPAVGNGLDSETTQTLIDAVRPHWTEGRRHLLALAISGLLAKAGVPEEQTAAIVEELSVGDDTPWDRAKAVHTTYERVRAGQNVQGYYGLQESLPSELVAWLDGVAQRVYQASHPKLIAGGGSYEARTKPDQAITKRKPIPDICLRGMVGDYVRLVQPLCEAPVAFHVGSFLALTGSIMGRSVAARYVSRNLHGNLYVMLVGPAGSSRKDTAIELALSIPERRPRNLSPDQARTLIAQPYELATDVGSAEGLINVLAQTPNVLLYITEYQRLVRNARRQSTSTIFPLLTTAWNTPGKIQNTTKGNPLRADFPCLSILAAVQPGILAQEMQQEDIESGFATRWLYVVGDGEGDGIPEPPEMDEAVAFGMYRDLIRIRQMYSSVEGGARLYLSNRAKGLWEAWYESDRGRDVRGDDEASMKSRLGVHIRKVALVYASLDGANEITDEHLEAATAFVEWSWSHTRELMKGWGVGVWVEIENRIESVLKEHGAMMRSDLAYRCRNRKWSAREFTQVLDAMLKNGTVENPTPGVMAWGL